MTHRSTGPDFIIIGAPKAGTTALHAALTLHPQVFTTTPKEPKYWLCDDAPPPAWHGPGDAHSQQEWVWRERDYEALFAGAAPDQVRGESTPFYLWSPGARRRIAERLPDARLIAVIRDPIDRAYSNWMHLWSDGLEPEADFEKAFAAERRRVDDGWAPFWRYRELGLYGSQLADLLERVDRSRVMVLRYRELIDDPAHTLDRVIEFIGVQPGVVDRIPPSNSRGYATPGLRTSLVAPVVRLGARAGAHARPQVWRAAAKPIVRVLQDRTPRPRPALTPQQRERLLPAFADDIDRLGEVLGRDCSDWKGLRGRGTFASRAVG